MTNRTASTLVACLIASVAWTMTPTEAHAQYRPHSRTVHVAPHGWYLGAGAVATRILNQEGGNELLNHGGGVSLFAGMRLNRSLALEAGWIGTMHNPEQVSTDFGTDTDYLVLNGFTADAKIFLGTRNPRMEPYIQAGVGLYLLDSEYFGAQSTGTGFQAGGGLDFKMSRNVDLAVRGLYRGLAMGPPNTDYTDTYVSALTVEGNLSVRF